MELVLYAAPMSSASPVVNALHELDVPHEIVWLDLSKGDQKRPEALALNPNGKVPTLVYRGTPMFEAVAIMQWLGDRFGVARGLWPSADAPERLTALSWTTWAYVSFGQVLHRLLFASSPDVEARFHNPEVAKASHEELQQLLGVLDGHLAERTNLLGEAFSLADLIVGSVITWATYCGVPVEAHDHVQRWLERFHARASYQKTWVDAPESLPSRSASPG